jgi:collagen triple helix repeat protein
MTRKHLPVVLSATALLVAVLGGTPLAESAADVVRTALFARNAGKVDGLDASKRPTAGALLALGANRKFPASVVPPGPPGVPGAAGERGPAGAQGTPGSQGAQGAPGADGPGGLQGPQGLEGPPGSNGGPGASGADGAQGPPGADGAEGPPGAQGPEGLQGPPGPKGDQGDPGVIGSLEQLNGKPCALFGRAGVLKVTYEERAAFYQPAWPVIEPVLNCLTEDSYEPNDTRETASPMGSDPGANDLQDLPNTGDTVIYPAGDDDWYSWENTCRLSLNLFSADNSVTMDVYVNGDLDETDIVGYSTGIGCRDVEIRVHSETASPYYFYGPSE